MDGFNDAPMWPFGGVSVGWEMQLLNLRKNSAPIAYEPTSSLGSTMAQLVAETIVRFACASDLHDGRSKTLTYLHISRRGHDRNGRGLVMPIRMRRSARPHGNVTPKSENDHAHPEQRRQSSRRGKAKNRHGERASARARSLREHRRSASRDRRFGFRPTGRDNGGLRQWSVRREEEHARYGCFVARAWMNGGPYQWISVREATHAYEWAIVHYACSPPTYILLERGGKQRKRLIVDAELFPDELDMAVFAHNASSIHTSKRGQSAAGIIGSRSGIVLHSGQAIEHIDGPTLTRRARTTDATTIIGIEVLSAFNTEHGQSIKIQANARNNDLLRVSRDKRIYLLHNGGMPPEGSRSVICNLIAAGNEKADSARPTRTMFGRSVRHGAHCPVFGCLFHVRGRVETAPEKQTEGCMTSTRGQVAFEASGKATLPIY
ncbi:hypothetical protein WOLCODRAFT_142993 [Wolfiporia cocos MD-104 SS10]|uniref:Uncharacterized protein n=1 Tax=Wolfiporia cocos (strain MD-104) TaxID=742152 RepID=A0A2H3JK75_WOLCO|nr:hypothetical protein WOLCODRAFT_142993 [Wolfiporia cocos MD-104 SS10]